MLEHTSLIRMYRALAGARLAEQAITDLSHAGTIPGHHSGLGHEAIGVGVGMALRADDCAQMSHRSGMMLAHVRGGYSLREAVLSKFGLAPSCSTQVEGRPRVLLTVGLVGTWVPMAVGVAMADRIRGKDTVTVTFFGDGAANEGAVHEAMNLAGARRLPIVFVVENNGMAISMPTAEATAAKNFASRAAGYGMPGLNADGHDAIAVYEATSHAVSRARAGAGPTLLELSIERWESHAVGIRELRSAQQIAAARARDGVAALRGLLIADGILDEAGAAGIESDCRTEVAQAVAQCVSLAPVVGEPAPISDAEARALAFAP